MTIARGSRKGNKLNQLSRPQGIYVDDDNQCIYIADYDNHRIVQWRSDAKMDQVVADGNGKRNQLNQFCNPTYLFIDEDHSIYVSDNNNNRVMK